MQTVSALSHGVPCSPLIGCRIIYLSMLRTAVPAAFTLQPVVHRAVALARQQSINSGSDRQRVTQCRPERASACARIASWIGEQIQGFRKAGRPESNVRRTGLPWGPVVHRTE